MFFLSNPLVVREHTEQELNELAAPVSMWVCVSRVFVVNVNGSRQQASEQRAHVGAPLPANGCRQRVVHLKRPAAPPLRFCGRCRCTCLTCSSASCPLFSQGSPWPRCRLGLAARYAMGCIANRLWL